MNTDRLSDRLAAVSAYVPHGCRLADIGSDHAYLPCHLVKTGAIRFAVAGEVAEGPFQSALRQVKLEGLTDRVIVRKGDGLEVIEPGEVDCVTIAGMGGALITTILESGKNKLRQTETLVLQPNVGAAAVRTWLLNNRWMLTSETILKEDGKIYEILVAKQGEANEPYGENHQAEILFGPFLMREKNDAFREKWLLEKRNWERILAQLMVAEKTQATLEKQQEMVKKIKMAEEVLQ